MSNQIKALLSHTYIGTLIHSCKAEDVEIIAAQEAAGFGSDIQAFNWPDVTTIPKRENWVQAKDLPNNNMWFAIAQPPCAGGSMVTPTHARGGLDNPKSAFHVTHDFMKYVYSTRAPIIAVESVPGTLNYCGGDIFRMRDMYAPDYGVVYVLDNSARYGCCSIRKRLWHIHYRKDLFPNGIDIQRGEAEERTVREALEGAANHPDHVVSLTQQRTYDKFKQLFLALPQGEYANNWLRKSGRWDLVPDQALIKTKANGEKFLFYESVASKKLAWDKPAPTITGSTFLIHPEEERPLTTREYLRINNMPDSFRFPPNMNTGKHITYIGKTVSTGIAQWIIREIKKNLNSIEVKG
jgi:DNA (cytosine-5)-methyltransferase 1